MWPREDESCAGALNFALSHFAKRSYIDLAQRFSVDN